MEKIKIEKGRDALIIVDVQNDFCPGGALPVPDGDKVVPVINSLLEKGIFLSIATRDWHPEDHCSFKEKGGMWPIHCVAGSDGANFHRDLDVPKINEIVSKADTKDKDAYSGFEDTGLSEFLKRRKIERVFVCGLATDYCVRATAIDAKRNGFEVYVLKDAVRGVDVNRGDVDKAVEDMKKEGIKFISSDDIEK